MIPQELRAPLYWKMTPIILPDVLESLNNRAEVEISRAREGEDFVALHGETVLDYHQLRQLIEGGLRWLAWLGRPARGVAADLGSGTGVGACILSKRKEIEQVYAVEYSEQLVLQMMPLVFDHFQAQVGKIQRVVGDFNNIELPDASLDLIVEIGSYHHSEDLNLSAQEAFRVLRPGGAVIAVDRAWPDETPQSELDARLDKEMPAGLKKKYGIPEDKHFTRRDFGEHEYTLYYWESVFRKAGFETFALRQSHPARLNSLWLRLPSFDFSIWRAVSHYRRGKRRSTVYGWEAQRYILIFMKPLESSRRNV